MSLKKLLLYKLSYLQKKIEKNNNLIKLNEYKIKQLEDKQMILKKKLSKFFHFSYYFLVGCFFVINNKQKLS